VFGKQKIIVSQSPHGYDGGLTINLKELMFQEWRP